MTDQHQPQSGIELESSYFWLAFLLYFFPPTVVVNGHAPGKVTWGRIFIPLAPGRHQVRVYFHYLFMDAGDVTATIDVHEGHVTSVTYKAPTWFVFNAGKLAVHETYPSGSRPFAPVPPAWGASVAQPAMPTAAAIPVTPVANHAPSESATDASPAGWHADPMGRHELRYWDGSVWTSHVSSQGTQSVDEVS